MSEALAPYTKASDPQKDEDLTDTFLHISSFVMVKKGKQILPARAGPNHFLEFRRKKWVLPAGVLKAGEHPSDTAKRVMKEEYGVSPKTLEFLNLQSHYGNHGDMCFIYEMSAPARIKNNPMFLETSYFDSKKIPEDIAKAHREVIDTWVKRKTKVV